MKYQRDCRAKKKLLVFEVFDLIAVTNWPREIRYGVKDTTMSTSYMKCFHVNAYEYGDMQTLL